jgi:hypothetical protein
MIRARFEIFQGLRAWRAGNYERCVAKLYAGVAALESLGRSVSPSSRLKLLIASALAGEAEVARTQLNTVVGVILQDTTTSVHDKNYLMLVIEASCQRLDIPTPHEVTKASRTEYPRVSNRLIESYPIKLLVPELL